MQGFEGGEKGEIKKRNKCELNPYYGEFCVPPSTHITHEMGPLPP